MTHRRLLDVLEVGPYPVEVSFYPEHFIIPLISLIIFGIIMYVIARIKLRQFEDPRTSQAKNQRKARDVAVQTRQYQQEHKQLERDEQQKARPKVLDGSPLEHLGENIQTGRLNADFKYTEIIALGGLIVTIVSALVAPFGQLPVLDYTVTGPFSTVNGTFMSFDVVIHNYGTIATKNVLISFSAEDITFIGFSSEPFLGDKVSFKESNSEKGKSLIEISQLPPRSQTIITMTFFDNSSKLNQKLTTYLRSDDVTGYHQISNLITFYLALVGFYVLFALLISMGMIYPLKEKVSEGRSETVVTREINIKPLVLISVLILSGIISANLLLYLSHLDEGSTWFMICYWVGILIIPVAILLLNRVNTPTEPYGESVYLGFCLSPVLVAGLLNYLPHVDSTSIFYSLSIFISFFIALSVLLTCISMLRLLITQPRGGLRRRIALYVMVVGLAIPTAYLLAISIKYLLPLI